MSSDSLIIKTFNQDVLNPNEQNVSVSKVFRSQINIEGLILKNWRFTSRVNYKSFCGEEEGVFCVAKIETMFNLN